MNMQYCLFPPKISLVFRKRGDSKYASITISDLKRSDKSYVPELASFYAIDQHMVAVDGRTRRPKNISSHLYIYKT